MRHIFFPLLLLVSHYSFCQDVFTKGYIVAGKDTVRGYIKQDLDERLAEGITFKNQAGISKVLTVSDINFFGFDDGFRFGVVSYVDPHEGSNKKIHFAKILMQGPYDLFSFRKRDDLYFVVRRSDSSYLLYDDERTTLGDVVEKGNFRNFLAFFGRECSKTNLDIANINFTEPGLVTFFKKLEACQRILNTATISYFKSKTERHILVMAGGFSVNQKSDLVVEALLQLALPSVNKKASINMGVAYLRNTKKSSSIYSFGDIQSKHVSEFYELPVLMRYDFLTKVIEPYLYIGPGVLLRKEQETTTKTTLSTPETVQSNQHSFNPTLIVGGGISVLISKNLFIKVDWRYDLYSRLPLLGIGFRSNKF